MRLPHTDVFLVKGTRGNTKHRNSEKFQIVALEREKKYMHGTFINYELLIMWHYQIYS